CRILSCRNAPAGLDAGAPSATLARRNVAERLIAIGDIHGCRRALDGLLEIVAPRKDDRLVFLGDYVDRGPDSRGVLQDILRLSESLDVVTLLGNHEEMMLGVLERRSPLGWWYRYGGRETMQSYDPDCRLTSVPETHTDFLRRMRDFHEEEHHFFVHANYVASEPLESQPAEALRWADLRSGIPPLHVSGKTAIVGHTSQKSGEVLDKGHIVCIDTFCVGGGWLTAMDLLSGKVWQADREGRPRSAG
ncbi:MAG: serine/threonine protein phosphatase, partial [Planctomycetales bacterium]|nr:serine/threonine protein phosphatase [Planctomycetales bacterium]